MQIADTIITVGVTYIDLYHTYKYADCSANRLFFKRRLISEDIVIQLYQIVTNVPIVHTIFY